MNVTGREYRLDGVGILDGLQPVPDADAAAEHDDALVVVVAGHVVEAAPQMLDTTHQRAKYRERL